MNDIVKMLAPLTVMICRIWVLFIEDAKGGGGLLHIDSIVTQTLNYLFILLITKKAFNSIKRKMYKFMYYDIQ